MEGQMNGTVKSEDVIKVVKPLDPILADGSVWGIMVDRWDRVLVVIRNQMSLGRLRPPLQAVPSG